MKKTLARVCSAINYFCQTSDMLTGKSGWEPFSNFSYSGPSFLQPDHTAGRIDFLNKKSSEQRKNRQQSRFKKFYLNVCISYNYIYLFMISVKI